MDFHDISIIAETKNRATQGTASLGRSFICGGRALLVRLIKDTSREVNSYIDLYTLTACLLKTPKRKFAV